MKLAHISDLHLGIELSDFSLMEDQKFILEQMLQIFDEQKPDGVLIAGDVYDKGIASVDAIRLFEYFLKQLAARKIKAFIISGNHDSAERLTFGRDFMESSGIYLSKVYDGKIEPVILTDENGPLNIYLIPFLKKSTVRFYNQDAEINTTEDAIGQVVKNLYINKAGRNVVVAHQSIINAEHCDSELTIIGGEDSISARIFDDFDYTALGHIHGPQTLGTNKTVRYCGTPLKYSLSEKNHKKSVTFIDFGKKGDVKISEVPLKPLREMREIKGKFADIVRDAMKDSSNHDDFISVILTDEDEILDAFYKLKNFFPHMIHLDYDNQRTRSKPENDSSKTVKALNPMELFENFYKDRNGIPMSDEQKEIITKLIHEIWDGE